ncbi:hypothetical protein [Nocardia sp. NPDC058497]|uniref:hypothetical protein n=1 Tax=Nocardia sp. NPDC058497 TaxID=3346529 RepID=UPI003664E7A3
MSHPLWGADELSSWQLRLLQRIHTVSYEHWRVLRNPPTWTRGSGDIQLRNWRAGLAAREVERVELELHATAIGVPEPMITEARGAGGRGVRWGDNQATADLSLLEPGGNDTRTAFLDQVARDVWQLEHMALVRAEYLHREHLGRVPDAEAGMRQLHDNIAAVWMRATATAMHAGTDDNDRVRLWGRGAASWERIARLTAAQYSDAELQARFHEFAWKGIEADAEQDFRNLAVGGLAVGPPGPMRMADSAEAALEAVSVADGRGHRYSHGIGAAVDVTNTGRAAGWEPEPEPRPPDCGPGSGHDAGVW